MNEIKDDSSKSIVGAIRRLVRLTYLDSRAMVKRYGITGPQSLVLKSLIESVEPLSSATLSRKLDVSPANITGIIDRLEEKGLVKRLKKQGDRRTILIELTEKGIGFTQQLPDLLEKKLIKGLSDLDSAEIDRIYMVFNKIIQIIEGVTEDTTETAYY